MLLKSSSETQKRIRLKNYLSTQLKTLKGYTRLVVLHLGKKLKLKKLKQNQNSSKKLPKNSRKSSQNSNYRKFFLQHCIQYFYEGIKGHLSRIFHPKTRIFCPKLNNSSENFKIFSKNSKIFAKTQGISAKTQFTGKFIPLSCHRKCKTTSLA